MQLSPESDGVIKEILQYTTDTSAAMPQEGDLVTVHLVWTTVRVPFQLIKVIVLGKILYLYCLFATSPLTTGFVHSCSSII